jgi:hypothetical protein
VALVGVCRSQAHNMKVHKLYDITPFMVHANWNKGAESKLKFLRDGGHWYLDDEEK